MANQHVERNKKDKEGGQVREIGEVDDVFTSAKDGVICGVNWWIRRVCSGHGLVSWTDKIVVAIVFWGCQVNKAGLAASSHVPYPPFVSCHVSVNSGKLRQGAAFTKAHNPHLNHGVHIAVIDHLGAT